MAVRKVLTRLYSDDHDTALDYYTKLAGVAPAADVDHGDGVREVWVGAFLVYTGPELDGFKAVNNMVVVDDYDEAVTGVEAAGGRVTAGPHVQPYGKFAHVALPDGSEYAVAEITDTAMRERVLQN